VTIVYQGAPGAFGHEACLAFLPGEEARALATFEAVAAAVAAGEAQAGLIPLANSRAGEVEGVRALIADSGLLIAAEHRLPVRMHLLGLADSTLAELRTVVSHPVALRQCAEHIARLGLVTEEAPNTALAARDLRDPGKAVLASEAAAKLYGLEILVADMQDDPDNATTFALVARFGRVA
jgi:prephenate dehydratase